jgi:hypothetical protein
MAFPLIYFLQPGKVGFDQKIKQIMRIKNLKDFYAGLMFTLFGMAFTWGALRYSMGTAAKMGPGYFPFMLGGFLTALGVIIFVRSLVSESVGGLVGRLIFKPTLLVFGSIAAFALLLKVAGLVVSIFAIILISSFASHDLRFKESLISAILLCVASLAIFVYGLNLQIPVWPAFIRQ